jgi:hypothetical protein
LRCRAHGHRRRRVDHTNSDAIQAALFAVAFMALTLAAVDDDRAS